MIFRNYQSDFEFYQELGNAKPAPFELTYYIPGKEQKLIVSYTGEKYTNCRPSGNGIIVSVDYSQVQLGIGKIRCTARYYLNNEHYKDGVYEPVSDFEIGIELHRGASDDMGYLVATPLPSYHIVYPEGGGGYTPPVGGIPREDLSEDVQTSLGKADTALQEGALTEYAKTSEIPTKTSELENDSGYITKDDVSEAIEEAVEILEGKIEGNTAEIENLKKDVYGADYALYSQAFYIDINTASLSGSTRVDVGGNLDMRAMWENAKKPILMDKDGNYCELNPNDCRYTAEGEYLLNEDGTIIDKYSHCDFMELIPEYYGRIQTITVHGNKIFRPWFSLVPLHGGYIIPQQVVAKFKSGNVSSQMRSLPGLTPDNTKTINDFWNLAQARSKNHGLANLDFRNYMLFHVMSKYGYRDVQNAVGADGTKVFGVGLDGTGSKSSNKFTDQCNIKTGSTLTLGDNDGNVAVTDNNGDTVHSVSVCGFENPYGQYWEIVQGLCSVGTDVYHWRGNVMPTGTPTAQTFAEIGHTLLRRPTTAVWGMNIIASEEGQGVYMIPKDIVSDISYGDYFSYALAGQLWLFGGGSNNGANCGLACAPSAAAWSSMAKDFSARLAFYGSVTKVSTTKLAELKTI